MIWRASLADPDSPRICLDIGTSFSKAVACFNADADPRLGLAPLCIGKVSDAEHCLMTPTAMLMEEERIYFGAAALRRARLASRLQRDPFLSFKSISSAPDVETLLDLKLSRSIDPSQTLSHRDGLVLYLAHLLALTKAAIARDAALPNVLHDAKVRLTAPLWQARSSGNLTGRIFAQADWVSACLGASLFDDDGVCPAEACSALRHRSQAAGPGRLEGAVLEGQAVASAYAAFAQPQLDAFLAVDLGAGAIDIAGFGMDQSLAGFSEIGEARRCSSLSCDEMNNIVLELALRRSNLRGVAERARLWRSLRLSIGDLVRDLLLKGKGGFTWEGRSFTLHKGTLMSDPAMKLFYLEVRELVSGALDVVAAQARRLSCPVVAICLAGGGANFSLFEAAAREAAQRSKTKILIQRFSDKWLEGAKYKSMLSGVLPQLAVAMGGALAAHIFTSDADQVDPPLLRMHEQRQ